MPRLLAAALAVAIGVAALPLGAVTATAAHAATGTTSPAPSVTVSGITEVVQSDPAPRSSGSTTTVLVHTNGATVQVSGALTANLRTGERVRVRGTRHSGVVRAEQVTALPSPSIATPSTIGVQSVYVIRADWTKPDATTTAQVVSAFKSAGSWFNQVSNGLVPSLNTTVAGSWVSIAAPTGCDYDAIWSNAVAAQEELTPSFNPTDYQHVAVYFPIDSDCTWGGLGDIAGQRVWLNGNGGYYSTLDPEITTHELGHNLGLYHSHSVECENAKGQAVTVSTDCPDPNEYGDPADVMGDSEDEYVSDHFLAAEYNAVQKSELGWLGTSLTHLAPCASVNLAPYESSPGAHPLAATIDAGTDATSGVSTQYWVEWRQPTASSVDYGLYTGLVSGILLHRTTSADVDPGPTLLDGHPDAGGDMVDADVAYGASVTTPEGYQIHVGHPVNGDVPVTLTTTEPSTPNRPAVSMSADGTVVNWTAPTCAGTSAISDYTVQDSADGGTTWTSLPESDTPTATSRTVTGLTVGVSYEFRVAATNDSGQGSFSDASTPTQTPPDASAFASVAPQAVVYGSPVSVTGALSDTTTGLPLAGARVVLERRTVGASAWRAVATTSTGRDGTATVATTPAHDTGYRWTFAGISTALKSVSPVSVVDVSQRVDATSDRHHVRNGRLMSIYGTVSPKAKGEPVSLQERRGGVWRSVGHAVMVQRQTLPDGEREVGFVFVVRASHSPSYTFRVRRGATPTNSAGDSNVVKVKVKGPTRSK